MKRRTFTLSAMGASLVSLPAVSITQSNPVSNWEVANTQDGLNLTLVDQLHPTGDQDHKQFILTFQVRGHQEPLTERIYDMIDTAGRPKSLYMSPVGKDRLQAVINWRTHA